MSWQRREDAAHDFLLYENCCLKTQQAFRDLTVVNNRICFDYSVIYFDTLQSFQIPYRSNHLGEMYFDIPFTCGFFGITDEGINEKMENLFREEMSFVKSDYAVGSMIYDFLMNSNIQRKYFISLLIILAHKTNTFFLLYQRFPENKRKIPVVVICVGLTKLCTILFSALWMFLCDALKRELSCIFRK